MKILKKLISKEYLYIFLISIVPVFLLYIPFILKLDYFLFLPIKDPGMYNIVRNWDGPNYIVVAKTFYDTTAVGPYLFTDLKPTYFAAHLPLYPALMALVAPIVGWLYSGVVVTLLFGVALNVLFYEVAKKYTKHPLFLTFVFTVFPARYLILRGVIAPETLLVFLMLLAFYFWEKEKVLGAALAGAAAVFAKVQAIFLFPAFLLAAGEHVYRHKKEFKNSYLWLLLIPLAAVGLGAIYYYRMGDFFAFLTAQSDNQLSMGLPFSQFNFSNPWSNTGWLEDVLLYIVGMLVLVFSLKDRKERAWFYFTLFYSIFLICLPHRDITRYAFPLVPVFLLQFEQFFTSKVFRYALYCALPAIYLYALNFMLTNQALITDWAPFVK